MPASLSIIDGPCHNGSQKLPVGLYLRRSIFLDLLFGTVQVVCTCTILVRTSSLPVIDRSIRVVSLLAVVVFTTVWTASGK